MATKTVTYGQLEHALERLGFTETFRSDHHITFKHEPSGAVILLPGAQSRDEVRPIYLITARKTVVENGLADEAEFADLLEQPCACE